MRRMRTVQQAAAYMKSTDPDTALTQHAIRRLVLTGQLPHIAVGAKRLVALEDLEAYLAAGEVATSAPAGGEIRPVEVWR